MPSHQENFGIAVAEALACGTPVLVSRKVNIWREVEQDEAGIVANDDPEGTCQLLRSWLALRSKDRHFMRERALECFRNRFEIKKSAESILATITPFVKSASRISMFPQISQLTTDAATQSFEDRQKAAI